MSIPSRFPDKLNRFDDDFQAGGADQGETGDWISSYKTCTSFYIYSYSVVIMPSTSLGTALALLNMALTCKPKSPSSRPG